MELPLVPTNILNPKSIAEATEIQRTLAKKVIIRDQYPKIEIVAGIDVSNNLYDPAQMCYAAVVNLDYKTLQVLEIGTAADKQILAYRPGFLGFREVPIILKALAQLKTKPDLLLVDGHGVSHPRKFGVATHLGVLLDIPSIGVAKSILIGKPAGELGPYPGDIVPLVWKEETIAMLLRSKKRSNPLIISAGHRVSLETAVVVVKNCLKNYRLPEPTRYAHQAANTFRVTFKNTTQGKVGVDLKV